jgi:hypothetical protein
MEDPQGSRDPDPALAVTVQPIDWTRRHGKCAAPVRVPVRQPLRATFPFVEDPQVVPVSLGLASRSRP